MGAYALVSSRRMDANSLRFQMINVAGAGLLALSAMSHDNWSSFASNLLWLACGAFALHRARRSVEQAVLAKVRDLRGRAHRADDGLSTVTDLQQTPLDAGVSQAA